MEYTEIKEPDNSNLKWAKYWQTMNEKLKSNHFNGNAEALKYKLQNGCGKTLVDKSGEFIGHCDNDLWVCHECREVLKILNAILGENVQ